jgi:beta-glucosidase/6-phospho-beta-glucosidase/beta-galactosidase
MSKTFASFFQAGFECSSHRRRDGVRLDLIRATGHDRHVLQDYRQLRQLGFGTVRDGLRWHLIEQSPGKYDWSSWLPALEAAEQTGMQVIWDLFHYGSPDHVDQAGPDFPQRFTDFALAALEVRQSVTGAPPFVCPLNEINFLSWAVDDGYFPHVGPSERGWFKHQLVRTAIGAARAIKQGWPEATIVWAEPLIHIAPHDQRRATIRAAEQNRQGMYEAYDWIIGLAKPELGGDPSLVDVVGWNFYPHNQWYYEGPTVPMGHHEYRPLADMLVEMAERYGKPVFLSETGAEGTGKPSWLHYVCNEVREAMGRGARIEGICWYPITAYPGWDNSRHAETGLLSTVVADGTRHVDQRLLEEFEVQRELFSLVLDEQQSVSRNRGDLRLV